MAPHKNFKNIWKMKEKLIKKHKDMAYIQKDRKEKVLFSLFM